MIKTIINTSFRYPVNRKKIRDKVKETLKKHGVVDEVEVGIFIVGDRKMKSLNKRFMKRNETTDVLSFPLTSKDEGVGFVDYSENERLYLGDIFVSFPQARKQAAKHNLLVDEEVGELVEHGILHLLGKHHE